MSLDFVPAHRLIELSLRDNKPGALEEDRQIAPTRILDREIEQDGLQRRRVTLYPQVGPR